MEQLVSAQHELYGRIARTTDNLRKLGSSKITLTVVQSTLRLLDLKWTKLEEQHNKLRTEHWDLLKTHEYLTKEFVVQAEDVYVQQRATLLDLEKNLSAIRSADESSHSEGRPLGSDQHHSLTTLPRIQLPEFSGRVEDWPAFRDLFASLICKEGALTNVEKLHYLKVSVKGSAGELIRNIPVTGDNFLRAWGLLTTQYENKRLLVRAYFSAFTSLPKMKVESAADLRKIHNGILTTVASLEGIGRPISSCSDLFVHLAVDLLDSRTRREWENAIGGNADPPTYEELRTFLDRKLSTLDALSVSKPDYACSKGNGHQRAVRAHLANSRDNATKRCPLCSNSHYILFCGKFKAMSSDERKIVVQRHGLCFNCLGRHFANACNSSKLCNVCSEKHHSLLHDACAKSEVNAAVSCATSVESHQIVEGRVTVLLATARVKVIDMFGVPHNARALIDPGSEISLVAESFTQRLRLPRTAASTTIVGVGGRDTGMTRGRVHLTLKSRVDDSTLKVTAFILPRLTSYGQRCHVARKTWPFLDGLELADPDPFAPGRIELLLGADVFPHLLQEGLKRGGPDEPVAQNTTLGWIVSGAIGNPSVGHTVTSHQCSVDDELAASVRRFWEQEEAIRSSPPLSLEEERCMEHFAATHSRSESGRYTVRLPFNSDPVDLSDTRFSALRLTQSAERKFRQDPAFQRQYEEFMEEYERLGHMSPVTSALEATEGSECFLPHHGVLRDHGGGSKLRVVFNGSTRTRAGHSLNDFLAVGPNLLPLLADVLLRWRRHKYVFSTDIEKMYRQVEIHPEDRNWQKILWGHGAALREFRLNTVTYGLASAPFLAVRTLQQLASDEGDDLPLGAAALKDDAYVDDIMTGASSISEALTRRAQLETIACRGGFPLRKWAANDASLLKGIDDEHKAPLVRLSWQAEGRHSTLGLEWDPCRDGFSYSIRSLQEEATTRRGILSQVAQLYDPLGWMSPVVIKAKCIMQSTWLRRVGWDDRLPDIDVETWAALQQELPLLRELQVPRWLGLESGRGTVEMHGFADASELAYAAVLYLRVIVDDKVLISLLVAKTKVAPLKKVSIPRLELCAASLLVAVASHAANTLNVASSAVHLWTDSMVTLGWIQGHPCRWTTYVANRVAEIQRALPEAQWHHVSGANNPADCASRGISPAALLSHSLWWQGPDFLRESKWTPASVDVALGELPEQRRMVGLIEVETKESEQLTRHSSLNRLLRVTAWMLRWRRGRKPAGDQPMTLTVEEISDAGKVWIRHVQAIAYAVETQRLRTGKPLPTRGALQALTPTIDEDGILRVGGRLKHAVLSYDERHPIILPPRSHLTTLVIDALHRRTLHGGIQLTLGLIRRKFWIPRGRQAVKAHIHRCSACVRWRAASPQPMMGCLPVARVAPSRPFLTTGVDYAGPLLVRSARGRGHKASKAFLAIFVCFSTGAVHLEAVSDYSTDAFLAALRRFTSRRGTCRDMYSDCGTNFVGADAQLRAMFRASSQSASDLVERVASQGTQWHFNPPGAPHFGGLWEAAVKSVKHHLRRVIGNATLTFEELSTLLTQIEACLNSRPLQALTDDPEDLTALTPGHFLIGEPLCAIPEPSLTAVPTNRLSRWQLVQQMRDHLWNRWTKEYVTSLLQRNKWRKEDSTLQLGQLCLVRSETTPPSRWPLARIIKRHAGDGGHVRVVTVRTATTSLTRPVVKIVPLPFASSDDEKR